MKNRLMKFRSLFASGDTLLTGEGAMARRVRTLVPECAACGKGTGGHSFALFATAVPRRMSEVEIASFIGLVRTKDWRALVKFRDFEGAEDDLELFAVFCPLGGGTTVLTLNPVEPFERNRILVEERLSAGDGEQILSLLSSEAPTGNL